MANGSGRWIFSTNLSLNVSNTKNRQPKVMLTSKAEIANKKAWWASQ